MLVEGKFLLIALVIVRLTLNVTSASNALKCLLTNGVSIVQKLVVKLGNTSTTFSQQIGITLSKFDNTFLNDVHTVV